MYNRKGNPRDKISWAQYEPFGIRFKQTYNVKYPPRNNNYSSFDVLESAPADYWEETQRTGYVLESFTMFDPSFPYTPEGDFLPGSSQPPAALGNIQYYLTKKIWIPYLETDDKNENGKITVRKTFRQTTLADEFANLMNNLSIYTSMIANDKNQIQQGQQQALAAGALAAPIPGIAPIAPPPAPARVQALARRAPTPVIPADIAKLKFQLETAIKNNEISRQNAEIRMQAAMASLGQGISKVIAEQKEREEQVDTVLKKLDAKPNKNELNVASQFDEKQFYKNISTMLKDEFKLNKAQPPPKVKEIDLGPMQTKLDEMEQQGTDVQLSITNVQNLINAMNPFAMKGMQKTIDQIKKTVADLEKQIAKQNLVGPGVRSNKGGSLNQVTGQGGGQPPPPPGGAALTLQEFQQGLKPIQESVQALEEAEQKRQAKGYQTPPQFPFGGPGPGGPGPGGAPAAIEVKGFTPVKKDLADLKIQIGSVLRHARKIKSNDVELNAIKKKLDELSAVLAEMPTASLKVLLEGKDNIFKTISILDEKINTLYKLNQTMQKEQNELTNKKLKTEFDLSFAAVNRDLLDLIDAVKKATKSTDDHIAALTGWYSKYDDDKGAIKIYQDTIKTQIENINSILNTLNSNIITVGARVAKKSLIVKSINKLTEDVLTSTALLTTIENAQNNMALALKTDLETLQKEQAVTSFQNYYKNPKNPLRLQLLTISKDIGVNKTILEEIKKSVLNQATELQNYNDTIIKKIETLNASNKHNQASSLYNQIKIQMQKWTKAITTVLKMLFANITSVNTYMNQSAEQLAKNQQQILDQIQNVQNGLNDLADAFNAAQDSGDENALLDIANQVAEDPKMNSIDEALAKGLNPFKNAANLKTYVPPQPTDTTISTDQVEQKGQEQKIDIQDLLNNPNQGKIIEEDDSDEEMDVKEQNDLMEALVQSEIDNRPILDTAATDLKNQCETNKEDIQKALAISLKGTQPTGVQQKLLGLTPSKSIIEEEEPEEKKTIIEEEVEEEEKNVVGGEFYKNFTFYIGDYLSTAVKPSAFSLFNEDSINAIYNFLIETQANENYLWDKTPQKVDNILIRANKKDPWVNYNQNKINNLNYRKMPFCHDASDGTGMGKDIQDYLNFLHVCMLSNADTNALTKPGYAPKKGWKFKEIAKEQKVAEKVIRDLVATHTGIFKNGQDNKFKPYNIFSNYYLTANKSTGPQFNQTGLFLRRNGDAFIFKDWYTALQMEMPAISLMYGRLYSMSRMNLVKTDSVPQTLRTAKNPFTIFMTQYLQNSIPLTLSNHMGYIDLRPNPELLEPKTV